MDRRRIFGFDVEGPVQAEVFVLYLSDRRIHLTGPCGGDAWYIELGDDDDPVETVDRMTRSNVGDPIVVHSTSWRRARESVILSFVVVIDEQLAKGMESAPVERSDLARSEATSAPASIAENQVLEHGLRHLSWLVSDDPVVKSELAEPWADVLKDYKPEPFRNLR